MIFENSDGGRYAHLFVQENRAPTDLMTPDFKVMYEKFSKRIIWMDSNIVPGAFQMNTAWYVAVPERDPAFSKHSHPYDEIVGFYGSDPQNPYELGGEIIFTMDGEDRRLTRSTMIFIPGGLEHNPMRVLRVDRPIFHFSVVMNSIYDSKEAYR